MESCFIKWVTVCTGHYLFWCPSCPNFGQLDYLAAVSPSSFTSFLIWGSSRFTLTFSCSSYGRHYISQDRWLLRMTSFLQTRRGGLFFHFFGLPNSGQSVDEFSKEKRWNDLKPSTFKKTGKKYDAPNFSGSPQYSTPVLLRNCSKSSSGCFSFSEFHELYSTWIHYTKNFDPSNTVVTVKTLKVFWLKESMTIFPSVTLKINSMEKVFPRFFSN